MIQLIHSAPMCGHSSIIQGNPWIRWDLMNLYQGKTVFLISLYIICRLLRYPPGDFHMYSSTDVRLNIMNLIVSFQIFLRSKISDVTRSLTLKTPIKLKHLVLADSIHGQSKYLSYRLLKYLMRPLKSLI